MIFRIISTSLFAAALSHAAIYVSPDGDDGASGSSAQPVATPAKALELSLAKNDPVMLFADGTYFLPQALVLSPEHSGTAAAPRVFRAEQEGKVIFSAGKPMEVRWESGENGVYHAQLAEKAGSLDGSDGLFIVGQQPRLARFPNYDRSARWLKGSSQEAFSPERIAGWDDPSGGILHSMHPAHWGANHWTITGKKSATELHLDGGWMNNRGGGIHPTDRFVENIREELDAADEWFLDRKTRTLYFKPAGDFAAGEGTFVLSQNESCIRILGSAEKPVSHLIIDGISFRHTTRTFMKTREPLLRSDWKIYRGGAVYLEGASKVAIKNCEFTDLGGNAYFSSGYNRDLSIEGCHFHQIGAGAINFVGLTQAVHNPMFDPYGAPVPFEEINKQDKGPKTNDYPAQCVASDCLIHDIGLVEKQVAGLQISVAHQITGRHLSIYDVPRAGINIGENAFGGHLIEHCDVFDTVLESSDHGSFNSWGRDRFWHTNYGLVNQQVKAHPKLPLIDMLDRNIIRNSRWRCDHGWDIDLDDGSSGYLVENNLCLGGGIKLREGYHRIVRNNLVVADTFHPHVWFENSGDIIEHNIWASPVEAIQLTSKGQRWDHNIHLSQVGLAQAHAFGVDPHGIFAKIEFTDPAQLDFTFEPTAAILETGFKPFDQSDFGVQKLSLKAIAKTPTPPSETLKPIVDAAPEYQVLGATIKDVSTMGEVSATGLPDQNGVLFLQVTPGALADQFQLKPRDTIRELNGKAVSTVTEFIQAWAHADPAKPIEITVWRTQQATTLTLPEFPGVRLSAKTATIQGSAVYDREKNYIGRWTEPNTQLEWSVSLKPNTRYRVLIEQASPEKTNSQWKLTGLADPIHGITYRTGDWETFQAKILDPIALSGQVVAHTLSLEPSEIHGALMNFRELILIEQ